MTFNWVGINGRAASMISRTVQTFLRTVPVSGKDQPAQATSLGHEHVVIEPGRTERHYWLDLWRHRELFYVLA